MTFDSLDKVFQDLLKDLYSAENQITKALPKMAKAASSQALREGFEAHLEETKGQIERLQQIADNLGIKLAGKKCKGMEGLLEEGKEVLEADGDEAMIDAALIAAAQKVEHYEIASYGTIRAIAEQLGHKDAVELLQETLEEESATDEKLTEIAESDVYPRMMEGAAADEEE